MRSVTWSRAVSTITIGRSRSARTSGSSDRPSPSLQVQVEQHGARTAAVSRAPRASAEAGRHVDHEGLGPQVAADRAGQRGVVFDQQDAHVGPLKESESRFASSRNAEWI